MKNGTILAIAVAAIAWLLLKGKSVSIVGFNASTQQLDALVAAGHDIGSPEYEAAVNSAYDQAADQAAKVDGVVAWSSAKGYHVISQAEAATPGYLE